MEPLARRAVHLDVTDPLASYRDRFIIDDDLVYLDGNSLGRVPIDTPERIREVVEDQWARELVLGWDHWLRSGTRIGDMLGVPITINARISVSYSTTTCLSHSIEVC